MSKLLKEEELEGRMDCFGEFDVTDEICLKYCGINIACASADQKDEDFDSLDEAFLGLPDVNLD